VGNAKRQADNQKKRTKTSDGSGDELEQEEEEEGEREEGHRLDDEENKKERRKQEIARLLAAEKEEEEELPSLGFSDDDEEEAFTASNPSARPTSRLDVPARSTRGSMSPPPSPIARSASPATHSSSSPSSPSLQQFFHHVNKVKKRMRDEDEIDTGVKTPTTAAATGDEEAGRAEPSDAVAGGRGLEGEAEDHQARLASTPDTSPAKAQALKLESPTKNTPSPRRGATPGRNPAGTTPLPSRIIRYRPQPLCSCIADGTNTWLGTGRKTFRCLSRRPEAAFRRDL
jgi:hypothetical protein